MKMLKSVFYTLLIAFALTFTLVSCDESESNDPSMARVNLEMRATTSASSISNGRTQNSGLEFLEVMIGVTEIELEIDDEESGNDDDDSEGDDDDDDEIEFEGNFIVDLVNGTSTPDFGVADIVPGTYEEIEIEMEPILSDSNTMFVVFEFTPEGANAPVRVEYSNDFDIEFEFESQAGYVLDANDLTQLLVLVDLDALFLGVDLNSASADVDGTIRINSNSNADLANVIAGNLDDAIEAGEDEDDDGDIDDD